MKAGIPASIFFLAFAGSAFGHGVESHAPAQPRAVSKEVHAWGREGDPKQATRTIEVEMSDAMRFTPSAIRVKRGETVRFVPRNSGQVLHEMVIGTAEELRRHAEMMRKHPGMEHDEPYMAHVKPGQAGEIAWTFTRAGEFAFACLVPGHYEAGMKGTIRVDP